MMEREIIAQLLGNEPQGSIGVLGDFCVDVYWALTPEAGELSLETGLMTTPVSEARYAPGGAGNIVENLRGLNVHDISCFGVVGRDPFGCWLRRQLNTPALLEIHRSNYHTPVYCKPLLNGTEQNRIDLGNVPLTDAESRLLLETISNSLPKLKVMIINEQLSNGIHSPLFRQEFARLLKQHRSQVRFVFDGRAHLDAYPGSTLKINTSAASMLAFGEPGHLPQESGLAIMHRSGEELVITDGENGCFVFEEKDEITHIPAIHYDGPVDTVGAGDSFTAGFAYALAAGATLKHAAMLGTCCSAVTIRKLNQTGSPAPAEIMALL